MLNLSCLCGQTKIELARRPPFINECNCAFCSKTGARWGYFHPSDVKIVGNSKGYRRRDKDQPNAQVHFCVECGSTTHFVLTERAIAQFGNTMMGVNMWLADPGALAGTELRFPDGRAWSGEGDFAHVREARVLA